MARTPVQGDLLQAARCAGGGDSLGGVDRSGGVDDAQRGHILVVGHGDHHRAGFDIPGDGDDFGSGIVHHQLGGQGRTLAQNAGIRDGVYSGGVQGLALDVILRDGGDGDGKTVTLGKAQAAGGEAQAVVGAGVLPDAAVDIVVSAMLAVADAGVIELLAVFIHDAQHHGAGVAQQSQAVAVQDVAGTDGGLASGIELLHQVGVAGLQRQGAVATDNQVVGLVAAEVGGAVIAVEGVGVADAEHTGGGPAAVGAQNRDGMGHIALDEDEALHICAVGVAFVQLSLLLGGQTGGDLHGDAAAGGHGDLAGFKARQDQVGVIGIHGTAGVQVSHGVDLGHGAGAVAQNELRVSGVGDAVGVQVAVHGGDDGMIGHAIHHIGDFRRQRIGGTVEVGAVGVLGEQLGSDAVSGIPLPPGAGRWTSADSG